MNAPPQNYDHNEMICHGHEEVDWIDLVSRGFGAGWCPSYHFDYEGRELKQNYDAYEFSSMDGFDRNRVLVLIPTGWIWFRYSLLR